MCQVVLDRLDLDLLQVEAELHQAPLDTFFVAFVTAVTEQNRIEGTIRRIGVTLGVLPAGLLEDADGSEGNRHHIDVRGLDTRLFQTELGRFVRHAVLRMLVAYEALLFHRRDQLAVDVQRSGDRD